MGTKGGSGEIAPAQVSYWLAGWKPTCQVSYSQNLAASTVPLNEQLEKIAKMQKWSP